MVEFDIRLTRDLDFSLAARIRDLSKGLASTTITLLQADKLINGKNIFHLLSLGAKKNSLFRITIHGNNEKTTMENLLAILDVSPTDVTFINEKKR
jgi:phosphotransferase system HPr-like phosphotransfer protein